jgi:hypothetical protein
VRIVAFLVLSSLSSTANAASVIAVAPAEQPEHPSIVTFGASSASPSMAFAATREPTSGSSIVILGEPEPGPADDKVSAIGDQGNSAARGFAHIPMVIRGGIVGDAFVRAAATGPSPTSAPVATAAAPPPDQPKPEAAAAPSSVYRQPAKTE